LDEDVASVDEEGRPQVEHDELAERVGAAVDRLPAQARTLIHLHYHEGMSIREAAEVVGMGEGAAKVALCRARKRLRELLVGDEVS
jgi:RNA polymerase sigma factor (sigma-70 family)